MVLYRDLAFSIVFREINQVEDYRKDWLAETAHKLVKNKLREVSKIDVEHIITPVINIFDDYKDRKCLSLIFGYGYYYDCAQQEMFNEVFAINKSLLDNTLLLIRNEYGGILTYIGNCLDSSYVEAERKKYTIGSSTITMEFGFGDSNIDNYAWNIVESGIFQINFKTLDSSLVYSVVPKEQITLPKKEGLRAKFPS